MKLSTPYKIITILSISSVLPAIFTFQNTHFKRWLQSRGDISEAAILKYLQQFDLQNHNFEILSQLSLPQT